MKKIVAVLIIACFILPQLAFAGAWTLPKNSVWGQYLFKIHDAKEDFGFGPQQGKHGKSNNGRSWGWSMIPELHYGVTDALDIFSLLEYKEDKYNEISRPANWGEYRRKSHGLTNIDFGGKYRFLENPVVATGQIRASIYSGNGDDYEPQIHTGQDSLELKVLLAKKFDVQYPFYFGLESGYRFRNRELVNDIPIFVEFGVWPLKWLVAKTEIDGYWGHDISGDVERSLVTWRIGPILELLTLWDSLMGKTGSSRTESVTRKGASLNFEAQYGLVIWGKNSSADQEVTFKISAQY